MWKRPRLSRKPLPEAPIPPDSRAVSSSRSASRATLYGLAIASALVAISVVHDVAAEGKTAFLAEQLRKSTDYRTRITAALSLGTSDDVAAVKPLCACLDDDKEVETVRIACAAGLGKLKKTGSETCLKDHASDKNAKVKEQVAASLKALGGGGAQLQCPNAPAKGTAKYYVGIDIGNKTSRPDADVKPMVEKEIRCKLQTMSRFKVAPSDALSPKAMSEVVAKEKLDGYFLTVTVDPIKYDSGQVKVSMRMTMQTHTRDIKGEFSRNAALPGVTSPSKADEDDLIKFLSEKLVNDFAGAKP